MVHLANGVPFALLPFRCSVVVHMYTENMFLSFVFVLLSYLVANALVLFIISLFYLLFRKHLEIAHTIAAHASFYWGTQCLYTYTCFVTQRYKIRDQKAVEQIVEFYILILFFFIVVTNTSTITLSRSRTFYSA